VPEAISKPLITTIIPTYRRPKLLRRAIRSVLAQTYPHFQVCVYDNASRDETPSVVDEMARTDCRIKYYCHPENIGGLKNFIYGMEGVETPFFSMFSDDDVLLPDFYQTALAGFEKYPEAMLSVLVTIQTDDRGRVLGAPVRKWPPGLNRPPEGLLAMLRYGHPEWTSVLFRREVLEMVGGLDEETGGPADLDFELRAAARFPLVVTLQPGAIFVGHRGSDSNAAGFDWVWPGWLKMVRNLTEDERIPDEVRTLAGRVLTNRLKKRLFVNAGFGSLAQRNWPDALRAADVLSHHYRQNFRARLLRIATGVCRHLPLAYYLLRVSFTLRRSLRRLKSKQLPKEYTTFIPQLKL